MSGCTNCSKLKTKGSDISYHRLPNDQNTRRTWLRCVRRENLPKPNSCYVVRRLRGRKHHNCSFCDKRTIFTGSSPFNMTIHIRYGGISEINPDSRKFKIS